jgi:Putative peptidoglycan binding domain
MRTGWRCACLILALLTGQAAQAQAPATAPPDPRFVAAQKIFEALPEAERRAIQLDLTFATTFSGAASGTFGALTFAALQRFERDNGLEADAILTPPERKQLAAKADEARKAVKFDVLSDARSGVRIGVPLALLPRASPTPQGGSRWQSADGKATLDTLTYGASSESLQQLYDRAIAPAPNRTITYKFSRPEMFVVTGETPMGKFYRRVSVGVDGALRGFALGYDKAIAPQYDRMAVAMANTFEPFPATTGASAPAGPRPVVAAAPSPAPAPATAPAPPVERLLTGVAVAPTILLTSTSAVRACRSLTAVGARRLPGRVMATDEAAGLALVMVENLAASPVPAGTAVVGALTGLSASWSGRTPALVFTELEAGDGARVSGALQVGGAGAGVFNAEGALVGVVSDDPAARRQVAGVVPLARYAFAGPQAISAFLAAQKIPAVTAASLAGPAIAARRASVVPLVCGG